MSKWSSLKFKVAQELGDCMDCTYLFFNSNDLSKKFEILNHADHDGISGLTNLLPKNGYQIQKQPILKDSHNPPSTLSRFKSLIKFLKLTKPVPFQWKKQKLDLYGPSLGFSFSYFSKELTELIHAYCQEFKISSTVFLMANLDKVITQELLVTGSVRKWFSPINMRGGVIKGEAMGNYSSSIIINADENFTYKDWQKAFVSFLRNRIHWGGWLYTNMAMLVGEAGTRFMARRLKDVGVGVFSNMGVWPYEGIVETNKNVSKMIIVPSAPASLVLPVAAASSIWNGHLALTLRIHPSLQLKQEDCERLHNLWIQKLLSEIKSEEKVLCEFISREKEYH